MSTYTACRTWRRFGRQDGDHIERQLVAHGEARCPHCGTYLVARTNTRLAAVLPHGARGIDLDCRGCRRFHSRIRHTPRSRYIVRIQRLAAAVLRA
jgi:hypothetical protein